MDKSFYLIFLIFLIVFACTIYLVSGTLFWHLHIHFTLYWRLIIINARIKCGINEHLCILTLKNIGFFFLSFRGFKSFYWHDIMQCIRARDLRRDLISAFYINVAVCVTYFDRYDAFDIMQRGLHLLRTYCVCPISFCQIE